MGGSWREAGDEEEEDGPELSLAVLFPAAGDEGGTATSSGAEESALTGNRMSAVTTKLQNKK
jgi:hypothetical protein